MNSGQLKIQPHEWENPRSLEIDLESTVRFWACLFQWGGVSSSISLSNRKWVNCQTAEITIVDSDSGIRLEQESCRGTLESALLRRPWADTSGPRILDKLLNDVLLSMNSIWGASLGGSTLVGSKVLCDRWRTIFCIVLGVSVCRPRENCRSLFLLLMLIQLQH